MFYTDNFYLCSSSSLIMNSIATVLGRLKYFIMEIFHFHVSMWTENVLIITFDCIIGLQLSDSIFIQFWFGDVDKNIFIISSYLKINQIKLDWL